MVFWGAGYFYIVQVRYDAMALNQKTVGYIQIAIGVIAFLFWVINFIATGMLLNKWSFSTTTSAELLIGIFAIVTGFYTLKK